MSTLRWQTVLFDFDGTVADTIALIVGSFRATLDRYGLEADEATVRSWIGRTLTETYGQVVGPELLDEVCDAHSAWGREHADDLLLAIPGMDHLVADLIAAGAQVGVATSRRRDSSEAYAVMLGLADLPIVVAMLETERHKPHPDPLLLAADRLGVDPAACVYVGDAVVDLLAADAAGMAGIGVTWGAGDPDALHEQPSVGVVDTVAELRALLLTTP